MPIIQGKTGDNKSLSQNPDSVKQFAEKLKRERSLFPPSMVQ